MSVVSLDVTVSSVLTLDDLKRVSGSFPLTTQDESDFLFLLRNLDDTINQVIDAPDYLPVPDLERFPRRDIHKPSRAENPAGAWAWKAKVADANPHAEGLLKGKTVALKDNICLAGVPCLYGTDVFTGWIPKTDATVVTRVLEAGGTILGKAVCENLCMDGMSFSAASGPVENPYAVGYSAGGSSSGCGYLVGSGEVDMGIGGDQGGSIRLPAAYCGLYGLKPTHGLVPYTGLASMDPVIDHTGPMTRTALDNALMLQVLAGVDNIDDRQLAGTPAHGQTRYYDNLLSFDVSVPSPLSGVKIGILKEAFDYPIEDGMRKLLMATAERFRELGAVLTEVSIPMHKLAPALWVVIGRMGGVDTLLGRTTGRKGLQLNDLSDLFHGWETDPARWDKFSYSSQNTVLNGLHLWQEKPTLYGKAINLVRQLRDAYDAVLRSGDADVLFLPTVPFVAPTHALSTDSVLAKVGKKVGQTVNTGPLNLTGHPALAFPIGFLPAPENADIKLPASGQLVGSMFGEEAIYKVAYAFDTKYNWKTL